MRTLIFNGSPRKNGDTVALIGEFTRHLPGEVTHINAYTAGIGPCIDCRACWILPGCAVQDGMQAVYAEIEVCDAIVIASPIYFSELTGPLLSVMSRLQTYYTARVMRGETPVVKPKRGGVILVGGGDGAMDTAERTARCLLRHLGATCEGVVRSHDTNHVPAASDEAALGAARQLARILSREGAT